MMVAPICAKPKAVALPMPALAPVTKQTFSVIINLKQNRHSILRMPVQKEPDLLAS
jgi:hypothetical protein